MKTQPTALDREAATLFAPAPGMRVMHEIAHVVRPASHKGREVCEMRPAWVRIVTARDAGTCRAFAVEGNATVGRRACQLEYGATRASTLLQAIDTDDPATVGCMLAQVREHGSSTWLQPLWRVSIPADAPYHGETMATVTGRVWSVMTSTGSAGDGPTEGAALVAAMRALKSTPTR